MNSATLIGYVADLSRATSEAGVETLAFTIAPEPDKESPDLSWGPALPVPVRARLAANLDTPAIGDLVLACGKLETISERDEKTGRRWPTVVLKIDGYRADLRVLKAAERRAKRPIG